MKTLTQSTKVYGMVLALAVLIAGSFGVARTQAATYSCLQLSGNLSIGMSDASRSGNVLALQNFLVQGGYMHYAPTGYFGPITYRAAMAFQAANGVPSTGYVGPLTRAAIQSVSCGSVVTPPSPTSVSIDSFGPGSGGVGTVVTIEGKGFDATDNTVHFAEGAIMHVPATVVAGSAEETLTFTVPSAVGPYCAPGTMCPDYVRLVGLGTYSLFVSDQYGTSNTVSFTVTGSALIVPQNSSN